jgi:hypothetical protein
VLVDSAAPMCYRYSNRTLDASRSAVCGERRRETLDSVGRERSFAIGHHGLHAGNSEATVIVLTMLAVLIEQIKK